MRSYLGIDIGGTSAKCGIVTSNGEITAKESFKTNVLNSRDEFLAAMYSVIDRKLTANISGIGICTPGLVNTKTGEIAGCVENLPYLEEFNLKDAFETHYGLPVYIENDVNAVALCENWIGAGKDFDNFCCITFGTGIGAALVVNSRLYEGAHSRAGEICYCNYRSEDENLEKKISTYNVMKKAAKKLGIPNINGVEFFKLLKNKEPTVSSIYEEWMDTIARFFANIVAVLDPDKIIIGGGISKEKDQLLPDITVRVKKLLPASIAQEVNIDVARYSNDAGILGAVSPFFTDRMEMTI